MPKTIRMNKMTLKVFSLTTVALLMISACSKGKDSTNDAPVPKVTNETPTPVPRPIVSRPVVPKTSGTPLILGKNVLTVTPGLPSVLKIVTVEQGNRDPSANSRFESLTKQITSDEKLAAE